VGLPVIVVASGRCRRGARHGTTARRPCRPTSEIDAVFTGLDMRGSTAGMQPAFDPPPLAAYRVADGPVAALGRLEDSGARDRARRAVRPPPHRSRAPDIRGLSRSRTHGVPGSGDDGQAVAVVSPPSPCRLVRRGGVRAVRLLIVELAHLPWRCSAGSFRRCASLVGLGRRSRSVAVTSRALSATTGTFAQPGSPGSLSREWNPSITGIVKPSAAQPFPAPRRPSHCALARCEGGDACAPVIAELSCAVPARWPGRRRGRISRVAHSRRRRGPRLWVASPPTNLRRDDRASGSMVH